MIETYSPAVERYVGGVRAKDAIKLEFLASLNLR